jgi:ribosomal protein L40E
VDNLWFFEQIPPKKIKHAIKKYAPTLDCIRNNEKPICLYDDTLFGSAKEGFILTDKRMYFRNVLASKGTAEVDEIIEASWSGSFLKIKTAAESYDILLAHVSGKTKKDAMVFTVNGIIGLLKGSEITAPAETGDEVKPTTSQGTVMSLSVCTSCGAPNDSSRQVCRYCNIKMK